MGAKRAFGLTLIELVVVLALMAIAASVVPLAMMRSTPEVAQGSWLDSLSWTAARVGHPVQAHRREEGVLIEAFADGRGMVLADTTHLDGGGPR